MRVLFVSLSDDIGTDRLVSEMARAGAACAVLGPAGCVASLPRDVSAIFTVPGGLRTTFALPRALRQAVSAWNPDRLVPLDDLSATLLRSLALDMGQLIGLRALCEASFGAPRGYAAACGRVGLMEAARAAGVRVPDFVSASACGSVQPHQSLLFPVMVKRDQSSGSGGVVRVGNPTQLATTVRRGWLKSALKAQIARLAGLPRPVTPVLVQTMVIGRLAMFTAVCRDGLMIDGTGFVAVESHPTKGSSTILRHLVHTGMADSARRVIAELGCSGFVSFDFIIDAADRAFLIEMNPRPIGSAHLGRRFGHDLVAAYLTGEATSPASTRETADIALFPKELERDPTGSRLANPAVHHDVPVHEPVVVLAYLDRLIAEHPAHAAVLSRHCRLATTPSAPQPAIGVQPELC